MAFCPLRCWPRHVIAIFATCAGSTYGHAPMTAKFLTPLTRRGLITHGGICTCLGFILYTRFASALCRYTLACNARSLSSFLISRHFYIRLRTTTSDDHSIVTMLRSIYVPRFFRNLRFLGMPRKRSADMNVRTHTRWMRFSPSPSHSPSLSPSPGRRCHFHRGPLGQPDTVRTRTVSDARHASDISIQRRRARPTRVGHCRTPTSISRAVSYTCRASDTVLARTVSGCPVQRVP